MEVRSRQDAKSVCIKRRHGAMSAGEVSEEESFVCYLKTVALIGLRGHGHFGTCLHFYREKKTAFSSLVDSRRIVPTHATRCSQQLIPFFAFWQIKSNLIVVGIELKDKQTLVVLEGKTTRPPGRPADS